MWEGESQSRGGVGDQGFTAKCLRGFRSRRARCAAAARRGGDGEGVPAASATAIQRRGRPGPRGAGRHAVVEQVLHAGGDLAAVDERADRLAEAASAPASDGRPSPVPTREHSARARSRTRASRSATLFRCRRPLPLDGARGRCGGEHVGGGAHGQPFQVVPGAASGRSRARRWALNSSSVKASSTARVMSRRGRTTPTSAMTGVSLSISEGRHSEVSRSVIGRAICSRRLRAARRARATPTRRERPRRRSWGEGPPGPAGFSVRSNPSTNSRGSYFQTDGRNTAATNAIETAAGHKPQAEPEPRQNRCRVHRLMIHRGARCDARRS